jgi:hypothetical protein
MRCWAITVEIGGREFEIPALPAADWWPVITDATAMALVDILKSSADLDAMLLDGRTDAAELTEVTMDAIGEATGRTFHAAFVLVTVAGMHWPVIGGILAQKGFRWDIMPIGAALDAVYAIVAGNMKDDAARDKFDLLLDNDTLTKPGKKREPSKRVLTEFEGMAGPMPAPAPLPGKSSAEPSESPRPRTRTRPRQTLQADQSEPPTRPRERPGRSGPRASS